MEISPSMDAKNSTTYLFSTTHAPASPGTYILESTYLLNQYETIFLTTYEFLCTVMTIFLNSYLLFLIICKVKVDNHPQSIPMLTAAVLGLFHGFGCNLMMTISLIHGEWVGPMDWCGAAANIHKYIVYSIIYCQVVVSLEVAYMISHPLGYLRDSTGALRSMAVATFIAVFITLPVTVAQFFFLFPDNIQEMWPQEYGSLIVAKDYKYYYYDQFLTLCYRYFFPGTLDYRIIVYFINTVNAVAVLLIALSFIVIALEIIKSRNEERITVQSPEERKKRNRRQNFKIARISVFSTFCVTLPWLPSLVISVITDSMGYQYLIETVGHDSATKLLRWNQFLYYLVSWLFPLVVIMTDPALSRASNSYINVKVTGAIQFSGLNSKVDLPNIVLSPLTSRSFVQTTRECRVNMVALGANNYNLASSSAVSNIDTNSVKSNGTD